MQTIQSIGKKGVDIVPKRVIQVSILLTAIIVLSQAAFAQQENEGYTIDGSKVYWEVEDIGKLEVYPHTTYGRRHCYQVNITSYLSSQDLDFAFEFDRSVTNKDVFIWKNYTHSVAVYEYENISTENGTKEVISNISYEPQDFFDWYSTKDKFSTQVCDSNDWHFIKNTSWDQNQKRQIKFCFNSPPSLQESKGTWHLFVKRSSDTIEDAIASDQYVKLHPWYAYGLRTDLIAYWSHDTDARDDHSVHNGTPDNPVHKTGSNCTLGEGCYYYDGIDDDITTTTLDNLGEELNTHSISMWINWSHSDAWAAAYGSAVNGQTQLHFHVNRRIDTWGDNGGDVIYYIQDEDGTGGSVGTVGAGYNDGSWHHMVATYDSGNLSLYVDNVLVNTSSSEADNFINLTNAFMIGARNTGSQNKPCKALIDEIAVWRRALSTQEIGYLWNSGDGLAYPFNEGPEIISARAYSSSNSSTGNLLGYCNATDSDDDNVSYYWKWYKDGSIHSSGWSAVNHTEGFEVNVLNLTSANLSVGNWTFSCLGYDGELNSSWTNSTALELWGESVALAAIESGILSALGAGYYLYNDIQVYVRLANTNQRLGTFDRVAAYGSQRWAFNYIDNGESKTELFNITSVLYVWENQGLNTTEISEQVSSFINKTRN